MKKERKPIGIVKAIAFPVASAVLAAALIAGNVVANNYADLITTYFSKSDYVVTEAEKEICKQVAAEGIVLLKNEADALPLTETEKKIAFLGQDSVDL